MENASPNDEAHILREIIRNQTGLITKLYCHIRFRIIPLRFLQEMVQYIPAEGRVLDIGCGFGLFTLYFAMLRPRTRFLGIDISPGRIEAAHRCAARLNLDNVEFRCQNVIDFRLSDIQPFNTVVTLDVLHHLPVPAGDDLLRRIHDQLLAEDGLLLVKDVNTRPRFMLYFTYLLDLLMNPRDAFYYRSVDVWAQHFASIGFTRIQRHYLWDILPYPHVLIVASASGTNDSRFDA